MLCMLKKDQKSLLSLFQCEFNRQIEEDYSKTLSGNEDLRLFFINENRAFTDGKNIIIDPATHDLYFDKVALYKTEDWMKIGNEFSKDPWNALKMITRAQNIHESLHIIYTTFPLYALTDKRATSKGRKKVLSLISNIIEDAFIEAVGCSIYDNIELFLVFGRVSALFAKTKVKGTTQEVLGEHTEELISDYLNYMVGFLLYPMIELREPREELKEYIENTKELFVAGSLTGEPEKRYEYTQRIFDIIEEIVPDDGELIDEDLLQVMLGGMKTHSMDQSSINTFANGGKSCDNLRRLFVDGNGDLIKSFDFKNTLKDTIASFQIDKDISAQLIYSTGSKIKLSGKDMDVTILHNHITINEKHPKINMNLKKAYQNIHNKYQLNINSYNSRFAQLLKARIPTREEKYLFGTGISSKRLSDTKKRFWYKNSEELGIPDIGIVLLIDGSGSMHGERRNSTIIASVILHEVLKKQGIAHSIVEHRASFDKPEIDINILVEFNAKNEEKYNLMQIDANGCNRDGLAIAWCEKYINTKCNSAEKLIIVLSDGIPAQIVDNYLPPASVKDTANIVAKIQKRGTKIIAIALDDNQIHPCYNDLKEIYSHIVSCSNLGRLTGQLLAIISKQIS